MDNVCVFYTQILYRCAIAAQHFKQSDLCAGTIHLQIAEGIAIAFKSAGKSTYYWLPTGHVAHVEIGYRPFGFVHRRIAIAFVVVKIQISGEFVTKASVGTPSVYRRLISLCSISIAVQLMSEIV